MTVQYFLSNLSHDLRTPLNGLIGYSQLLLNTRLDNTQKEYLKSMNNCCHQLIQLVNDVLDFSKLCMGKVNTNRDLFSVDEIIEDVKSATSYKINERKQTINYIKDNEIPEFIICDSGKLTQILVNLVSNASKFSPIESRIIVNFTLRDNFLECIVEDEGIGISSNDQKRIFEPFVQIEEERKNGFGLGLAICKQLTTLLGGDIVVESEVGKGSVFTFWVKFEKSESLRQDIEKNSICLKKKYVLVVDDNIDNRIILYEILLEYGMYPILCCSAREAIKIVSSKKYPFVVGLLDICMPDMSGIELGKQIKSISELPLIALSSLDKHFDTDNFEFVLQKPINNLKLIDMIIKVISRGDISQFELSENKEVLQIKEEYENKKILIAEDVYYNSDILKKMLNSMKYEHIDIAQDGKEVVSLLNKKRYDILILDLKMPNMNGIEVAKYIKENKIDINIVVISASVSEKDRDKCREYGVKYFLLKPFNINHLKNIMNKLG